MNIEKLRVKNFKRFTDLEIDLSSCQAPPKLVLLIGANGSGKSSVFDAFEYISAPHKQGIRNHYVDYFEKSSGTESSVSITLGGGVALTRSKEIRTVTTPRNWNSRSAFYGRSSFRTVPELRPRGRSPANVASDSDRPQRFIEHDIRFDTDISEVTEKILREVWGEDFNSETMRARFVDPINDSLARIFGNGSSTTLRLIRMIPALEQKPPDVRFQKGHSDIHYDLLSSGEKEVFNIVLNTETVDAPATEALRSRMRADPRQGNSSPARVDRSGGGASRASRTSLAARAAGRSSAYGSGERKRAGSSDTAARRAPTVPAALAAGPSSIEDLVARLNERLGDDWSFDVRRHHRR